MRGILISLALYDSNVDDNYLQLIRLPGSLRLALEDANNSDRWALTRSFSDDALWVGMSNREGVRFWMLPKDEDGGYKRANTINENEWMLMRTITNNSLRKGISELLQRQKGIKNLLSLVSLTYSATIVND